MTTPTNSPRRRATHPVARVPVPDPTEAEPGAPDAPTGRIRGVGPHLGSARLPGETRARDGGSSLAKLAARPLVERHPLERYLLDRGVSVIEGARLLGVSRWTLRDWFAGRSAPPWWRRTEIARALGFDDATSLFPDPEPGMPVDGESGA